MRNDVLECYGAPGISQAQALSAGFACFLKDSSLECQQQ
jgi:hypothetical protein